MSDCIFCKIAAGEIPATVVYEDEEVMAFKDLNPLRPVHILVIPKRHIGSLAEMEEGDQALFGKLLWTVKQIAEQQGIAESGYRIVNNCGKDGGQAVGHLHFHLLGGEPMQTLGA